MIHEALPDVQEARKWRGTPVWEHNGILCTGETYKQAVKLTFANGAALADPKGLFNASRRATRGVRSTSMKVRCPIPRR